MPSRLLVLLIACVAALGAITLSACGGDDDDGGGGDASEQQETTDTAADSGEGCRRIDEPPPPKRVRDREAPSFRLDSATTYTATVKTSCGTFVIELDSEDAPKTGGSFVTLARDGFYDGLTFHRIVPDFVIQGGDPRGIGTGNAGYQVREEPPDDIVYSEGVVAMAKAGDEPPGTSGSQFFVVTAPDTPLEPDYALLGKVTKGLDVVHTIERVPVAQNEQPVLPIVIDGIEISEE